MGLVRLVVILPAIVLININCYCQPRSIPLADDILLKSAQIVANVEYLGILDSNQKLFLLFDHQTGEFITEIDARDSFPGFNWYPLRAKLLKNEIFFTNSGPWGVYVSYENQVSHVAGSSFLASASFDFINDSLYVGFYTSRDGNHEVRGVNRDGAMVMKFDEIRLDFPTLSYRSDPLNQLLHHNGHIYMIPAYSSTMYVFDLQGGLVRTQSLAIPGFVQPRRDKRPVLSGNFDELFRAVVEVTRGRSYVGGLYALNENELLIVCIHDDQSNDRAGSVTRINTLTGQIITGKAEVPDLPLYAGSDKVYFLDLYQEPLALIIEDIDNYWLQLD
jgi:hypothetical protein